MTAVLTSPYQIESNIQQRLGSLLQNHLFFQKLNQTTCAEDFKWCVSLYVLSKDFTDLLRIRHERFQNVSHDVFISHYEEEIGHAEMLRNWMMEIGLEDPEGKLPTPETAAFVSLLTTVASEKNEDLALLAINTTAEGFAYQLFTRCLKQLQVINLPNLAYWEIHCEADEEHCNVARLLSDMTDEELAEANMIVDKTLGLIDIMLSSWTH